MGVPVHGARGGAELYYTQCAEWGRAHLAGVDGLDRMVEPGEQVIAAAPVRGLPLFAGWAAMPKVADAPGRAMQVSHVLRELHGALHTAAVTAAGIGPAEAHLLAGKPEMYTMMGWAEPFPSVDHLKARYEEARAQVDQRYAEIVAAALSVEEAEEFAAIAAAMSAAVSS